MYTTPSIPFIQASGVVWVATKYESRRDWFLSLLDEPLHPILAGLITGSERIKMLSSNPTAQKRTVDFAEGAVWGGLRDYLVSITLMLSPDSPAPLSHDALNHQRLALACVNTLIGPDLTFLKLPYQDQWIETEKRIARLDSPLPGFPNQTLRQALVTLGLTYSLEQLEALHTLFGQVIGATVTQTDSLSAFVTEWNNDLEHFMSGVYFHHNPAKNLAARPLIDALLAPIHEATSK